MTAMLPGAGSDVLSSSILPAAAQTLPNRECRVRKSSLVGAACTCSVHGRVPGGSAGYKLDANTMLNPAGNGAGPRGSFLAL
jgi:hypothetical protein